MDETTKRILSQIQSDLGDAVLLPIPLGEKGPVFTGWQQTALADMVKPDYLEQISAAGNIGVLLGKPSGGLCTIDIDNDDDVQLFLSLNPKLDGTLRTRGRRGCNFWVRISGVYPDLTRIHHRHLLNENGKPLDVGEWRATGGQTVIFGKHPSGCRYQRLVKAAPVKIAFADLNWPDCWRLPWCTAPADELVRQHGEPYTLRKGNIRLNPVFFAAKYAAEHVILWQPNEGQFYEYDTARGIWRVVTRDAVKLQFSDDIKRFADETELPQLLSRRSNSLLNDLTELLKGHIEKPEAFEHPGKIIHLQNCMLDLTVDPPARMEFSPEFYSRNQSPFQFVENAECPRFEAELLRSALESDDISLLQRWCGSILLKHNAAQKILLLTGTAGAGKSTLVDIIERIIGPENCCELRTEMLLERFELGRFIGRTLLSGKDVPGNFLQCKGASALKKLVGHDLLSAELKKANGSVLMRGDYHVVVTCNSRLHVKLDGDVGAWRRRLLIVRYEKPQPTQPVRDFADALIAGEGSGILLWMIKGAVMHLAELDQHGDFQITPQQRQRVESLLNESDSVRHFASDSLVPDAESDVTTDELVQAYYRYCDSKGWRAVPKREVENELPDIMLQVHRLNRRTDIQRDGTAHRGYSKICLICPSTWPS